MEQVFPWVPLPTTQKVIRVTRTSLMRMLETPRVEGESTSLLTSSTSSTTPSTTSITSTSTSSALSTGALEPTAESALIDGPAGEHKYLIAGLVVVLVCLLVALLLVCNSLFERRRRRKREQLRQRQMEQRPPRPNADTNFESYLPHPAQPRVQGVPSGPMHVRESGNGSLNVAAPPPPPVTPAPHSPAPLLESPLTPRRFYKKKIANTIHLQAPPETRPGRKSSQPNMIEFLCTLGRNNSQ